MDNNSAKFLEGSSSSSSPHNRKYDMFLSFRDVDTRLNFIDHLHKALIDANVITFLDDTRCVYSIDDIQTLDLELETVIKASRASIIVLSENYASSRRCLDELVIILEQHRNSDHIVIPIFYHVDPTDVRKQQRSFGAAMAGYEMRMEIETNEENKNQWDKKLKLWRNALAQVADLKGKSVSGRRESEFVEEIVTNIHGRLGISISRYDVFLSFRGYDTRLNYTDHLHKALINAKVTTFLDDDEIDDGLYLKPRLEIAIKASRASIIVLSENYASSTWCLDELVLILEQHRNYDHIVIPIFYHVDPTDVRRQQGSFGYAIKGHKQRMETQINAEKRSEWDERIELWKKALSDVANLSGYEAKGRLEAEFIEEIVNDIYHKLGLHIKKHRTSYSAGLFY